MNTPQDLQTSKRAYDVSSFTSQQLQDGTEVFIGPLWNRIQALYARNSGASVEDIKLVCKVDGLDDLDLFEAAGKIPTTVPSLMSEGGETKDVDPIDGRMMSPPVRRTIDTETTFLERRDIWYPPASCQSASAAEKWPGLIHKLDQQRKKEAAIQASTLNSQDAQGGSVPTFFLVHNGREPKTVTVFSLSGGALERADVHAFIGKSLRETNDGTYRLVTWDINDWTKDADLDDPESIGQFLPASMPEL